MGTGRKNGSAASSRRRSALSDTKSDVVAVDPISGGVANLLDQGVDALRVSWARRFRCPAPPIQSADMLRRLFAWRLQAEAFGDLDAGTVSKLKRARNAIAKGMAPIPTVSKSIRAGTILVREWRGITHRVLALDSGFEHEGTRYGSLSEVARAISGTRWSGPRFFGLEQKPPRVAVISDVAEASP